MSTLPVSPPPPPPPPPGGSPPSPSTSFNAFQAPPSPSGSVGNAPETSLFGIGHSSRLTGRRQSLSRAFHVATTPVQNLEDNSDDEGIITVDPLTHKASVVRAAADVVTKETLDRLDGRSPSSGGGSGRYSVHRSSVSGPNAQHGSHSSQFPIFDRGAASSTPDGASSPTSPPPPPPPLSSDAFTIAPDKAGEGDDEYGFDILKLPQLNAGLASAIQSRRRPSLGMRSPTIRGESVLRTSVKSLPHSDSALSNPQSDQDQPFSGTGINLPTSIDLEEIVVQEDANELQKAVQSIQQNLLTDSNYHYIFATPAVPVTSQAQSKLPNVQTLHSGVSSIGAASGNQIVTPVDYLGSQLDQVQLTSVYRPKVTPVYDAYGATSDDLKSEVQVGNSSVVVPTPASLHAQLIHQNLYESPHEYYDDQDELNLLQDMLDTSARNLGIMPKAISSPTNALTPLGHATPSNARSFSKKGSGNFGAIGMSPSVSFVGNVLHPPPVATFQHALEQHAAHQALVTQPITDRRQFQLSQYQAFNSQHEYLQTAHNPQLPSKHQYAALFLPQIYPTPHQPAVTLSTTPAANTTTAIGASSTTSGGNFGSILSTKAQYTWTGSHNRQALKKRRVQVLRFALNENQYQDQNSEPNDPNQNQSQGTPGDSDSDTDGNLLYTHHSNRPTAKPDVGSGPTAANIVGSSISNMPEAEAGGPVGVGCPTPNSTATVAVPTEISEHEFIWQQRNARKLMARATVPAPNDVVLEGNGPGQIMSVNESSVPKTLPLPYSTSGVATIEFMTKQLDSRPSKEIMKGRRLLATLTEAYQEDSALPSDQSPGTTKPSLFGHNKRLNDDGSGSTPGGGSMSHASFASPPQTNTHKVSGLSYTTPLKSILVNSYTDSKKQQAQQHLWNMHQYEELCKKRMRQGCIVLKYKQHQPTKRFLYLSHNDTMLSWRELTTKEEKKYQLWDSMPEEWKEVAVTQELAQAGDGSSANSNDEDTVSNPYGSTLDDDEAAGDKEKKSKSRWSSFLTSTSTFKSNKHVPIDDIKQIFYGPFVAVGFQSFVDQCRKSNAKPWYATTIQAASETLNIVFMCNYDVTLWLQGLYMLAPSTGKAFTLGKMLWLRTIMKINFVGYNDFVFNNQHQQSQFTIQQQQSLQEQRQHLSLQQKNMDEDNDLFDGQDNALWAVWGSKTPQFEDLPMHSNPKDPKDNKDPERSAAGSGRYEPSHVSTSYHGSTTVASLRPAVNLNAVPQIFNNGGNFDWSEKVCAPGIDDMSKHK